MKLKEYVVLMRITSNAEVIVLAKSAKEARRLAEQGDWFSHVETELIDWEITGQPMEDK